MKAIEYRCQACGHKAPLLPDDHPDSKRMFLDCPACGVVCGLKLHIDAPGIQKWGNQKGTTTYEEIYQRPR